MQGYGVEPSWPTPCAHACICTRTLLSSYAVWCRAMLPCVVCCACPFVLWPAVLFDAWCGSVSQCVVSQPTMWWYAMPHVICVFRCARSRRVVCVLCCLMLCCRGLLLVVFHRNLMQPPEPADRKRKFNPLQVRGHLITKHTPDAQTRLTTNAL